VDTSATTPQLLRHANLRAVLDVLRTSPAVTGTDLIQATGLTRATVIAVCDDLIARGWARETDASRAPGGQKGRPARKFEFNQHAGHVLGLDVGMATVRVLVADLAGAVVGRETARFSGHDASAGERSRTITATIDAALEAAGVPAPNVLSVGVGVAAPVDRRGRIAPGHHLGSLFDLGHGDGPWADRDWPVLLENDANLAALAERWRGSGSGVDNLAVVLAGERLSSGIIESGRLLHGASGGAGELGTLEIVDGVGSHDGIAKLARLWGTAALRAGEQTLIRDLVGPGTTRVSARFVFEAAAAGDALALDILDRIARRMARVLSLVSTFFDPELVVIGGAVAASATALLPALTEELGKLVESPPRVAVSDMGDALVPTGAVRLALDHVESNMLDLVPAARRGA